MKNASFEIEVTSHILANSMGIEGGKDKFPRDGANNLIFQAAWFYAAFNAAIKVARVRGIKPSDVHMDLTVKTPTDIYKRKYGDNKYRSHEAIMPGTKVNFNAIVADHVTESGLREILDKMGRFVGLSPYGHNLGYGRFTLCDVKVASSEDA